MGFTPTFLTWQFAAAGALCAAGPVIIHLLNRRRYRVLPWAAMEFLREAMQQSRRILRLRDLLLLALRTAAVLLFGLALAQPYFSSRNEEFRGDQPVHAVLLIDNSLSMAYQQAEGSLLEIARRKARELIEQLPSGSLISIVPLCGSRYPQSLDPYRVPEHALEALARIEITDRTATLASAVNAAKRVCEASPELAKRVILFADQQRTNWTGFQPSPGESKLPPIQAVDVGFSSATSAWENSWIADVRVQDGLADVETPATIIAELRHRGPTARTDVTVTLEVNGQEVGSKIVTLEPGEAEREVSFEHSFDTFAPEPGQPVFVPVSVRLAPDRLVEDDVRHAMVPVVASLPVVFVDQVAAAEENPAKNRLGETRHLRTLLAPGRKGEEQARQLISVRHRRIDELDAGTLTDARLVVVAGLSSPDDRVPLLRQYVEQGGQLFLAAGAEFDPLLWNQLAWRDGEGILPLPLRPETVGEQPEEAQGVLQPFFLSFDSLAVHDFFQIAGVAEADLRDLYAEPVFFKTAVIDEAPETLQAFRDRTRQHVEGLYAQWLVQDSSAGEAKSKSDVQPWDDLLRDAKVDLTAAPGSDEALVDRLTSAALPTVLARYAGNNLPALVERRIGRGKVVMLSTGILSNWNTLPKTNAVVMLDRILRTMILDTLPQRNFTPQEQLAMPIVADLRDLSVMVLRPGEESWESLEATFVSRARRGVAIPHCLDRGIYRVAGFPVAPGTADARAERRGAPTEVTAEGTEASRGGVPLSAGDANRKPIWELSLSVNGDPDESDLTPVAPTDVEQAVATQAVAWVGWGETVSLAGIHVRGQNLWWWLALLVLVLLIAEAVVILTSAWQLRRAMLRSDPESGAATLEVVGASPVSRGGALV